MTPDEQRLMDILQANGTLTTKAISDESGIQPPRTRKMLKSLQKYGYVKGEPSSQRGGGLTYVWTAIQ